MKGGFVLFQVLVLWGLFGVVSAKQCTNTLPLSTNTFPLSSHTMRYELLSSKNETWKKEMLSHYHLTPNDDSVWTSLLPRKVLREEDEFRWAKIYRKMKYPDEIKSPGGFLREVSLHDVSLGVDSLHWKAQQTNLEYLLMLDVDRLVWSFRATAGLQTPGEAYGGWEKSNSELRGHFVGHYMSATALMWASTHNDTLKEKMSAVVSALYDCQKKMDTGYLSAFPSKFFDRLEALKNVWAPYYTIHKILAGLLDQYEFAGNVKALKMTTWMIEYFYKRVQNVILKYSLERHWQTLNEETGGMNDLLYRLFSITRDPKHLFLAHLFDKPCFLGSLAVQADDLSGFHANTHIPIVVGSQRRYEVTGDPLYKAIGRFFMDIVNSSHSYATGGSTLEEHWTDPKRLGTTLAMENEESCSTYNMLKVSRHLFRWTKEMAYADYYERALTNGVLGIQRGTEPGVMIYMLPLGPGASKARSHNGWGTKFGSFWCCYGTGIESFSKLGDSIYFEENGKVPSLYIIQYISSILNWNSGHIKLNQKVDPVVSSDPFLRLTFTFSLEGQGQSSTLNLRIPFWTNRNGAKATLNNQSLPIPSPGTFLSVTQQWSAGDILTLQLPLTLRTEAIKDDRPKYASVQAILYGPYLLAGHSDGDWKIKTDAAKPLSDWITPVPSSYNNHLVTFSQKFGEPSFVLTNTNKSITMEKLPQPGTNGTVHATFRLIFNNTSPLKLASSNDVIGKSVMLEPFGHPGMLVVHKGTDNELSITDSPSAGSSSYFRIVSGLDGRHGTISLESENQKGCIVYVDENLELGKRLKLSSSRELSDTEFNHRASFVMQNGLRKYNPISFQAKGESRNFLLEPLLSFRDESYTVYFKIESGS